MGRVGLSAARISLFVFCCLAGIYIGPGLLSVPHASLWGGIGGGLLAVAVIILEINIKHASGKAIVGGIIGLVTAFFLTHLVATVFFPSGWKETWIPMKQLRVFSCQKTSRDFWEVLKQTGLHCTV